MYGCYVAVAFVYRYQLPPGTITVESAQWALVFTHTTHNSIHNACTLTHILALSAIHEAQQEHISNEFVMNFLVNLSIWLYSPLLGLGHFFSFLTYTQLVRLLGRVISPSQGHYLHTQKHKHRMNSQTSMPQMAFEHTIPVFEWAKTVHALDREGTVIGFW
jgi:hypothetical protein